MGALVRYGIVSVVLAAAIPAFGLAQTPPAEADRKGESFFETRVRPILVNRCYECHGPDSEQEAGLRVDSLRALLRGGDSGPAVVPGKPSKSLLIDAINYGEIYEMPPDSKMPQGEIDVLTKWVEMGAPWPASDVPMRAPAESSRAFRYTKDDRNYWAFQPIRKPELPVVRQRAWIQSPIDHFVLAALESAGLSPSRPASKRVLIRRVTFDLHGLPPTPEEIEDFLEDESPDAFARVVDRLLASPRYGERWGRHWLDVARYGDSNGGDQNRIHAHAWRYRDYVVSAFNEDMPYDRFVVEQLAGDLLPARTRQERNRLWTATGFLVLGPKPLLKNDDALCEMDVVDEQIRAVSGAIMGLTLGCSRCHDHKFDPLPMTDYYALAGIFKSTRTIDRYVMRTHRSWTERALGTPKDEARHQKLKEEFDYVNDQRRLFGDNAKKRKFYVKEMDRVRRELAGIPVAMAVREGTVADCPLHRRGNPRTLGEPVKRGFPKILCRESEPPIDSRQSGRLQLAYWLTSPEHPLTDRVVANRIWQWHFGAGIVRTPNNFGRLGARPDNQSLLDWLAVTFRERGRSWKRMHRLLLLSSAYQMSSEFNETAFESDPENRLLWRFPPRRLEAEEIRDALLAVAGRLDLRLGGAPLPAITNYELVSQKKKTRRMVESAYVSDRRSVYLPVIRSGLYDLFRVFDFANPGLSTGTRATTTVAPQALLLMNSEFTHGVAESFAGRLRRMKCASDRDRIAVAYALAFGRRPNDREQERATMFLEEYHRVPGRTTGATSTGAGAARMEETDSAFTALCRSILCANEFVFIE